MRGVNFVMFGVSNLTKHEVEGQRVIEFGSCNVNGALHALVQRTTS